MMKKNLHLISYRLLITIAFLCFFSKGMRADDTTPDTWENLASEPANWSTSSKEISISSAAELAWVAKMVNENEDTGDSGKKGFEGAAITLTQDIDLADHNWIPIGEKATYPFKGSFNGGNFKIQNIYVSTLDAAGLFGITDHANIKNIQLTDCDINKKVDSNSDDWNDYAGGIVAAGKYSTIDHCTVNGKIIYQEAKGGAIGGIAGVNYEGTVSDCSFEGILTSGRKDNDHTSASIGGIVGENSFTSQTIPTITDCNANISITSVGGYATGGITSKNGGFIKNCTAQGKIDFIPNSLNEGCGGIVGGNQSNVTNGYSIEKCTSSCDIHVKYQTNTPPNNKDRLYFIKAGGIAGMTETSYPIDHCTTSGTIKMELTSDAPNNIKGYTYCVGGIIGYSKTRITACESTACIFSSTNFAGTTIYAGGIAGYVNSAKETITDCKSSTRFNVEGETNYVGGITGYSYVNLTNCQYNTIDNGEENQMIHYSDPTSDIYAIGKMNIIGGLTALNYRSIKNCYSTANITSEGEANYIGDLVGWNYDKNSFHGEIQDCYTTGNISASGKENYIGGIAGYNPGKVTNCYATGKVEAIKTDGDEGHVGGITGNNLGSTSNCLALNTVGVINYTASTGRIIGTNSGTTTNNYAHSDIPGQWNTSNTSLNGEDWDGENYPFSPADAWDLTNKTQLPKLKKINSDQTYSETIDNQPTIPLVNLSYYTITFDTPQNGTLIVSTADGTSYSSGDKVQGGTELTITATPEDTYQLDELTVNSTSFASGTTWTVSEDITISATFSKTSKPDPKPEPDPTPVPPIYHTVTLPQIEGATTDPVAGEFEVEAWSSFRFYLTLDKEYDQSSPIVTTDRGETITPRSSDGAYIIKYVRQPIAISIDGIVRNPDPVANETISTNETTVRAEGAYLHLHTSHLETVFIYTFNGTLLHKYDNLSGDKSLWLPQGNYIVIAGNKSFKIQIQK